MSNEKTLFSSLLSRHRLTISFNPPADENCQFSALCEQLSTIRIYRSAATLRKEIVEYMKKHPNGADGFPLERSETI